LQSQHILDKESTIQGAELLQHKTCKVKRDIINKDELDENDNDATDTDDAEDNIDDEDCIDRNYMDEQVDIDDSNISDHNNKGGDKNYESEGNIGFQFKEHPEGQVMLNRRRSWILKSGIDVEAVLAEYVEKIPDSKKFLKYVSLLFFLCTLLLLLAAISFTTVYFCIYSLAYWNILDLTADSEIKNIFSSNDWAEMVESFEKEVELVKSKVSTGLICFFDELEKVSD
jgi:hypothetical protein